MSILLRWSQSQRAQRLINVWADIPTNFGIFPVHSAETWLQSYITDLMELFTNWTTSESAQELIAYCRGNNSSSRCNQRDAAAARKMLGSLRRRGDAIIRIVAEYQKQTENYKGNRDEAMARDSRWVGSNRESVQLSGSETAKYNSPFSYNCYWNQLFSCFFVSLSIYSRLKFASHKLTKIWPIWELFICHRRTRKNGSFFAGEISDGSRRLTYDGPHTAHVPFFPPTSPPKRTKLFCLVKLRAICFTRDQQIWLGNFRVRTKKRKKKLGGDM